MKNMLSCWHFDFVPDTWDEGKTHVWQKLNPITRKQYDYGGVSLCPKEPQTKGRPKYIRQVCSTQKQYPVYTMTAEDVANGIPAFYKKCAEKTDTKMFWVVSTKAYEILSLKKMRVFEKKCVNVSGSANTDERKIKIISIEDKRQTITEGTK